MARSKRARVWKRILFLVITIPILLFAGVLFYVFQNQDKLVQEFINTANADFAGRLTIEDTHISPFANFPYVSIDLEGVKVYESKEGTAEVLLDIQDIYLGFDLLSLVSGTVDIKSLKIENGSIKLIQHVDGTLNILNALSQTKEEEIEDPGEEFHMHLKRIHLVNIDLLKYNESNDVLVEAFISDAQSTFSNIPAHTMVSLDSRLELNLIIEGDTTFVHHKDIDLHTSLDYSKEDGILTIQPSEMTLEKVLFLMEGTIDVADDMNLDLTFKGRKSNFDLFLAFAPEELAPLLSRYDNGGKIFFEAKIQGKSINNNLPLVVADFGCEDAFFNNTVSDKKVDDLFFKGHFTTGEKRNPSTMEFSLSDFTAKPEAGVFKVDIFVKNFEAPEIEMKLDSEFDLEFLADFLSIENIEDPSGRVSLTMNFHDIIDIDNPEKSIESLNESYYTELSVEDLSFKTSEFHLPINDIDIKAHMDGHMAIIDTFYVEIGESNLGIKASISDLPAIIHHTSIPVVADMEIRSNVMDIKQLTLKDSVPAMDEKIEDLSMRFKFNSSAKAFTESPNLPTGEFFIEDLYAQLTHYPHTLHDFHADVFVDTSDFRVVDFTGMIDESDFHFNGRLKNYDLWFEEEPLGDTKVEFNLTSALLQLEDLFSYGGENYVPEDYRHEEFQDLKVHGFADLHFNDGLQSSDVNIDLMEAQMKVHPFRFEKFKGRLHFEDEHLVVQDFSGKLGESEFLANLNYYLGKDTAVQKRDNYFSLKSPRLNFDQLFAYNPPPSDYAASPEDHEAGFNIFDVPFSDMTFDFDIKHLRYHRYLLDDFVAKARMQANHYVYLDTFSLATAGGNIYLNGYFNGSDPEQIYFSPDMTVENIDLDKLLFKFENFGQDQLVSDNLHGKLSGRITGMIHMHADMVPIIDDSEVHIDMEVVNGSLNNYAAFDAMSSFFKNKNLSNVRFDTLRNQIDINNGILNIPKMNLNTTLGFFEISGQQSFDTTLNMEYYLRVPWKIVTKAAVSKLFGKNKEIDPDQVDEIEYRDESKRVRFVNVKISGTPDDYKVAVGKKDKRSKKSSESTQPK